MARPRLSPREQEHAVRQQARQAANHDDDRGIPRSRERAEWWVARLSHELDIVDAHGEVARAFVRAYLRAPREAWPADTGRGRHSTPAEARRYRLPDPSHHYVDPRHVADFDDLDDLINHAARDLGATHVIVAGPETRIFFPRGGQYPYEEARVFRKNGYWHAEGPGSRQGVTRLPREARPIEGVRPGRAAEAQSGEPIARRFRVGSRVVMTPDALENYGQRWQGIVFVVTHVSTAYMPSGEFFSRGQPAGYHPGFDPGGGSALYDLAIEFSREPLNNSLYDWELAPAPGSMKPRRRR